MTERVQRFLWTGVALAAVVLSVATLRLFRLGRSLAASRSESSYDLVYLSDRDGMYQLYTCGLLGENDRPLPGSESGDVLPACRMASDEEGKAASVAFLHITDPAHGPPDVGMWGTVRVLTEGRRQAITVSGAITRVLAVAPTWSPAGDRIAFAAVEDSNSDGNFSIGETGLYVAYLDGRPPVRVASGCSEDTYLSWSPNAEMILFQATNSVAQLVDLSDGSVTSRDEHTTLACWSPDGQRIAAYSTLDRRLHVLSIADGAEEYSAAGPDGELVFLSWLPQGETAGKWLALASTRREESSGTLLLRTAGAETGLSWRSIEQDSDSLFYPSASPDGRWIAYNAVGQASQPSFVVHQIGSKPVTLFSDGSFAGLACWTNRTNPGSR